MAIVNINIDSQVLTFSNAAAFPATGKSKTIYIAEDTNISYYWDGTTYVNITSAGSGLDVGTTPITNGTVGRLLFEGAGNLLQQDINLFWDNTNKRLGIRESAPDASLVIRGPGTTTGFALKVHNAIGTNNAFVVRDDGKVGILTNNPSNPLEIGSVLQRILFNHTNGNAFYSRQDITSALGVFLENTLTTGINTAALFGARAGNSQIAIGTTSDSYNGSSTNQYLGNQPLTGTIIQKNSTSSATTLRFVTTNLSNALINKFEWVSGTAGAGLFVKGTTATPIMTLIGNGNLLLGTTTDVPSSILTLESTTKGFLPPRNADPATNITSPATGLVVYNTTTNKLQVFNGTSWIDLH